MKTSRIVSIGVVILPLFVSLAPSASGQEKPPDIKSIAVPPLGCGLGGLDWQEVYPRIEAALGDLPGVEVLVYQPDGAPEAAAQAARSRRLAHATPVRAAVPPQCAGGG